MQRDFGRHRGDPPLQKSRNSTDAITASQNETRPRREYRTKNGTQRDTVIEKGRFAPITVDFGDDDDTTTHHPCDPPHENPGETFVGALTQDELHFPTVDETKPKHRRCDNK